MAEAKLSENPLTVVLGWPARRIRMWLLSRSLRHGRGRHFVLPPDLGSLRGILVVAPEEEVDAINSAQLVLSLRRAAPHARIVLVCEDSVAGWFSGVQDLAEVYTYEVGTPRLLASLVKEIGRMLGNDRFDLCLFLQRFPREALVYLVGQSHAPLRIGYAASALFPFLNVRIRGSEEPGDPRGLSAVRQALGLSHAGEQGAA